MKITVPLTIEIYFDIDDEDLKDVDPKALAEDAQYAALDVIHQDIITDSIVEAITDHTGWCIRALSLSTPDMVD